VGNTDWWIAQSYMVASTANSDLIVGRNFRGGLRFRTLCATCNNSILGGKLDKAIGAFFSAVRKLVESPLLISGTVNVAARPNEIYKGLLAHMVSANDNGVPSAFDVEAREIVFGKRSLNLSSWSLFYWIYKGDEIFLMRHAYHTVWHPMVRVIPMHVLKLYPLGFMFAQEPWFMGLPNMRSYLQRRDEDEIDLPVQLGRVEDYPTWPVVATRTSMILLGGDAFGLVARRD
jgi:hypothetical protein